MFVTIPFSVRTLQPVIRDIPRETEEAARCLGTKPWQTFVYVLFPALFPAWLTGFSLALARGIGEYGSVVFIAANIPYKTEILPLLIVSKLDQFDYVGGTVVGVLILLISFVLLFATNLIQRYVKPASLLWMLRRLRLPAWQVKAWRIKVWRIRRLYETAGCTVSKYRGQSAGHIAGKVSAKFPAGSPVNCPGGLPKDFPQHSPNSA